MKLRNSFKYLVATSLIGGWGFSAFGEEQKQEFAKNPFPLSSIVVQQPTTNTLKALEIFAGKVQIQQVKPGGWQNSGGWQNKPSGWNNEDQKILNQLNTLFLEIKSLLDTAALNQLPVVCENIIQDAIHQKLHEDVVSALSDLKQLPRNVELTKLKISKTEADHLTCAAGEDNKVILEFFEVVTE